MLAASKRGAESSRQQPARADGTQDLTLEHEQAGGVAGDGATHGIEQARIAVRGRQPERQIPGNLHQNGVRL